jgi:hypothetical protein
LAPTAIIARRDFAFAIAVRLASSTAQSLASVLPKIELGKRSIQALAVETLTGAENAARGSRGNPRVGRLTDFVNSAEYRAAVHE